MTETKETLAILKARWREVVLIIAFDVLSFSINMTHTVFHPIGTPLSILITILFFVFNIITFMLIFGFERTVYTEGLKKQSFMVLLREGGYFFLRLAALGIIYSFALACLQLVVFWAIKHIDAGILETHRGISLVYPTLTTSFNLILMKPVLLIFPLIIVLDCGIFDSFKMLGRCRLRDARELVILFLISLGLPLLWELVPDAYARPGAAVLYYLITATRVIVGRFIALTIAVMAIRFVAARNLRYDDGLKPLDTLNPSV
jgi:hypothetical protein